MVCPITQGDHNDEMQDAVTAAVVTRDLSERASAAHDGQKLHGTKCVVAFISENEMHGLDNLHKALR